MNLSYFGLFPFRSQSNTTVAEPEPQAELYYSLTGASSNKSPASLVWVSSKSLPVAVVAVGVDSVAVSGADRQPVHGLPVYRRGAADFLTLQRTAGGEGRGGHNRRGSRGT